MSHWNHRVVQNDKDGLLQIHEIYYNDNGEIWLWSNPVTPSGETIDELKNDVEYFIAAFDKPVLNTRDLPIND